MLGILTVTGIREAIDRQPGWRAMLASLGAGVMLFTLTGSNPTSDLVVHLGGFVWGLAVGVMLEKWHRNVEQNPWLQTIGSIVFGVTLLTAWMMALAV